LRVDRVRTLVQLPCLWFVEAAMVLMGAAKNTVSINTAHVVSIITVILSIITVILSIITII
jgi:hypothetical protein